MNSQMQESRSFTCVDVNVTHALTDASFLEASADRVVQLSRLHDEAILNCLALENDQSQ